MPVRPGTGVGGGSGANTYTDHGLLDLTVGSAVDVTTSGTVAVAGIGDVRVEGASAGSAGQFNSLGVAAVTGSTAHRYGFAYAAYWPSLDPADRHAVIAYFVEGTASGGGGPYVSTEISSTQRTQLYRTGTQFLPAVINGTTSQDARAFTGTTALQAMAIVKDGNLARGAYWLDGDTVADPYDGRTDGRLSASHPSAGVVPTHALVGFAGATSRNLHISGIRVLSY